ncbi:hypothetical protein [Salipiger mucosus]|uniref:hypothetical protein n=1 Tax=Salipiger mucosus TaxID=263378 RepID=UPI0018DDD436|nr:hypothetical protein [Salipiger mucosus]
MLSKIVAIFLVVVAVMGMFGKLRLPGREKLSNVKCPDCGRYRIGKGPCPCKSGKKEPR